MKVIVGKIPFYSRLHMHVLGLIVRHTKTVNVNS
jgi:hypothetical protein